MVTLINDDKAQSVAFKGDEDWTMSAMMFLDGMILQKIIA